MRPVLRLKRSLEPTCNTRGVRDGGADDNGPGASIDRGASLLGRMHATLANDGKAGEFLGRLTQERQVGAIGMVQSMAATP